MPFRWVDVDALYLEPQLAPVRNALYGSEDLFALSDWVNALKKVETEAVEKRTCFTLIFHPYLLGEEEQRYTVFAEFLEHIKKNDDIWLTHCSAIADWARAHKL